MSGAKLTEISDVNFILQFFGQKNALNEKNSLRITFVAFGPRQSQKFRFLAIFGPKSRFFQILAARSESYHP